MKLIIYDFDNVIHQSENYEDDPTGEPVNGAEWAIELLIKKGYGVVICTARKDLRPVRRWLKHNGFPKLKVTNKKPVGLAYVDDRGIRFTNHVDVVRYFI